MFLPACFRRSFVSVFIFWRSLAANLKRLAMHGIKLNELIYVTFHLLLLSSVVLCKREPKLERLSFYTLLPLYAVLFLPQCCSKYHCWWPSLMSSKGGGTTQKRLASFCRCLHCMHSIAYSLLGLAGSFFSARARQLGVVL